MVKYTYLADGTKLNALNGNREGLVYRGPFVYRQSSGGEGNSSLTFESASFGGGLLTSSGVLLYVKDYLGSVRAVLDADSGALYKAVDYSAYGDAGDVKVSVSGSSHPIASASLPSGLTLRDGYTGKEDQYVDFGTGYVDFGARQYSPALHRWLVPDPLSEKFYGISPYAFCNSNPMNYVDVDGRDWYFFQRNLDNSDEVVVEYAWTHASSQNELDDMGVQGTYLGEAVVIFNGYYDEKLGSDGTLTGEGAKPADVMIYGIAGPDDIVSYHGLSVSSDPSKYSMIAEGEYRLFYQPMATSVYGKGSLTYRVSNTDNSLALLPVGGTNISNNLPYMTGIFLHRTNWNGFAKSASQGCLIIDGRMWRSVEEQLKTSMNIYLKLMRQ